MKIISIKRRFRKRKLKLPKKRNVPRAILFFVGLLIFESDCFLTSANRRDGDRRSGTDGTRWRWPVGRWWHCWWQAELRQDDWLFGPYVEEWGGIWWWWWGWWCCWCWIWEWSGLWRWLWRCGKWALEGVSSSVTEAVESRFCARARERQEPGLWIFGKWIARDKDDFLTSAQFVLITTQTGFVHPSVAPSVGP